MANDQLVVTLIVDLIGSTQTGLALDAIRFRRFNRALVEQLWPYLSQFNLDDSTVKFTGDGWIVFQPSATKIRNVVALAKCLGHNFQSDVAAKILASTRDIPPLRMAIGTGYDEQMTLPNGSIDWVGDSARIASRILPCGGENELLIDATIQQRIRRDFDCRVVDIDKLPEDRKPRKREETIAMFAVGVLRASLKDSIQNTQSATDYAPYITLLSLIGQAAMAKDTVDKAVAVIESELPDLRDVASLPSVFVTLLGASVSKDQREAVLRAMVRKGIPIAVKLFNAMMSRTRNYQDALGWLELSRKYHQKPDVFTFNILINLSPDLKVAEEWLAEMKTPEMKAAGVRPDVVTYTSLIDLAPDFAKAKALLIEMGGLGIRPNEQTASSIAKSVNDANEANQLVGLLDPYVRATAFHTSLYAKLVETMAAEDLLNWHFRQERIWNASLEAAVAGYYKRHKLNDALRVALAFPYFDASCKIFRQSSVKSIAYFRQKIADNFELENSYNALGICYQESGQVELAVEALQKAREEVLNSRHDKKTQEKKISHIEARIARLTPNSEK